MSQNTCRKTKVIRPEEGGFDPVDRTRGSRLKKPPVESFWAFYGKPSLYGSIGGNPKGCIPRR